MPMGERKYLEHQDSVIKYLDYLFCTKKKKTYVDYLFAVNGKRNMERH